MSDTATGTARPLDLLIIGAGIGGVIALYYARKAGLRVRLLERQTRIGGLWAALPPWQDIQFSRMDWTLGDLPIAGEDQGSIRDNVEAWVNRFGLADAIELGTEVTKACRVGSQWALETPRGTYRATHLLAATGAHNRPHVPSVERNSSMVRELHSSQLRHASQLRGRNVIVVGGGASAYDLLDLCFEHEAGSVTWVYRSTRWMYPTLKPKSQSGGPRPLAKAQMEGASSAQISKAMHADMMARYLKYGLQDILPSEPFDLERHQLIPGRFRMIQAYPQIRRHRAQVVSITGHYATLSTGERIEADLLLWGTGYEMDLSFFANPALASICKHDELVAQCGSGMVAIAEPNLYFLATVLETTGTAPWTYALLARTLVAHIRGQAMLELVPLARRLNHFQMPAFLAARDPVHYPAGQWEAEYQRLALAYPVDRPLPIP